METIYYTTRNFIRHEGNVVDFTEYCRRMQRVEGSLALEETPELPELEPPRPVRRQSGGLRRALQLLDAAATLMLLALAGVLAGAFLMILL